jgi:hypothetical protein
VPYYWAGAKVYDLIANMGVNKAVPSSYFINT